MSLFWECHIVKHFWNEFKTWYDTQLANRQIYLDISDILFGTQTLKGKNIALDFMILLAKYKKYNAYEKYNAYTECNWKGFDEKWAHHKHLFQN